MKRYCQGSNGPAGLALAVCDMSGQRRAAGTSMSVKDHRKRMENNSNSLYKGMPATLFNVKIPDTSLFINRGDTRFPQRRDTLKTEWGMLKRMGPEGNVEKRAVAVKTMEQMYMHPAVTNAVESLGVTVPSLMQQISMPMALNGKSVQMCGPTGSGKTIAFLAPVFHRMMQDRDRDGIALRKNRPRTVLISPTLELVHQTWSVAQRFGQNAGFTVAEYNATEKAQGELLKDASYDVLVTTGAGWRKLWEKGYCVESDIKYVVYDEADVVFGGSVRKAARSDDRETLMKTLKPLLLKQFERESYLGRHKVQFLLASSTITVPFQERVKEWLPHVHLAVSQDMHVVPPKLAHRFYHSTHPEKMDHLRGILGTLGHRPDPTWAELRENSKRNFWFPDAVTFESGEYSPLDEGSWVTKMRDPTGKTDMPRKGYLKQLTGRTLRPVYLKEYTPEWAERAALPAPVPRLLLPGSPALSDVTEENRPKDAVVPGSAIVPLGAEAAANKDLMIAHVPDPPKVFWGPVSTVAAPFTGLPGLMPQRAEKVPRGARAIVFVRDFAEMMKVSKLLDKDGYRVAVFGGEGNLAYGRQARVAQFEKWATGEVNLLIATDQASRGLDHYVESVVNYSLPHYVPEFLNRSGRAGRMGRRGIVHSIVHKNNSVEVRFARTLEARLAKNHGLHQITADDEAFRAPLKKWWKKRQIHLEREWEMKSRRGFISVYVNTTFPSLSHTHTHTSFAGRKRRRHGSRRWARQPERCLIRRMHAVVFTCTASRCSIHAHTQKSNGPQPQDTVPGKDLAGEADCSFVAGMRLVQRRAPTHTPPSNPQPTSDPKEHGAREGEAWRHGLAGEKAWEAVQGERHGRHTVHRQELARPENIGSRHPTQQGQDEARPETLRKVREGPAHQCQPTYWCARQGGISGAGAESLLIRPRHDHLQAIVVALLQSKRNDRENENNRKHRHLASSPQTRRVSLPPPPRPNRNSRYSNDGRDCGGCRDPERGCCEVPGASGEALRVVCTFAHLTMLVLTPCFCADHVTFVAPAHSETSNEWAEADYQALIALVGHDANKVVQLRSIELTAKYAKHFPQFLNQAYSANLALETSATDNQVRQQVLKFVDSFLKPVTQTAEDGTVTNQNTIVAENAEEILKKCFKEEDENAKAAAKATLQKVCFATCKKTPRAVHTHTHTHTQFVAADLKSVALVATAILVKEPESAEAEEEAWREYVFKFFTGDLLQGKRKELAALPAVEVALKDEVGKLLHSVGKPEYTVLLSSLRNLKIAQDKEVFGEQGLLDLISTIVDTSGDLRTMESWEVDRTLGIIQSAVPFMSMPPC